MKNLRQFVVVVVAFGVAIHEVRAIEVTLQFAQFVLFLDENLFQTVEFFLNDGKRSQVTRQVSETIDQRQRTIVVEVTRQETDELLVERLQLLFVFAFQLGETIGDVRRRRTRGRRARLEKNVRPAKEKERFLPEQIRSVDEVQLCPVLTAADHRAIPSTVVRAFLEVLFLADDFLSPKPTNVVSRRSIESNYFA